MLFYLLCLAVVTGWAYSATCLEDKNGLTVGTLVTLDYASALSDLQAGNVCVHPAYQENW